MADMKFCLIGPGCMPIPPKGWGACEILIWDYACILRKYGYDVTIINERDPNTIIAKVKEIQPTVVHIQFDEFAHLIPHLKDLCKLVLLTTHYAYLTQPLRWGGWSHVFQQVPSPLPSNCYIFCLSEEIKTIYHQYRGIDNEKIIVMHNGAREDQFRFDEKVKYPEKSICVGKIESRKRQHLLKTIESIDFVGNIHQDCFDEKTRKQYKGEWDKETLFENLTNYANLILLSDGEADPLVVKEALMAGLGVVVSSYATANLDLHKEFIDVIPEERIHDVIFIKHIIEENRKKSISRRNNIHEYAIKEFSWDQIVLKKYIPTIQNLLERE